MKTGFITCLYFLGFLPALWSQTAPLTIAGKVTDAVPGNPAVPITINTTGFTDIGQFTLTLKFDTLRVRYMSATTNPDLPGMTVSYTPPSGDTKGKIIIAWTGASNVSLADGVSLAGLTFHYVIGTGILSWAYTFGDVCRYKSYSGGSLVTLADIPRYLHYQNGGISSRVAPQTYAPVLPDPMPGALSIPVTVDAFSTIKSFTLYLEYDPAIITFQNSFTKHPAFDANFIVGDNSGSEGKRLIVIQWYGATTISLADGSTLCTLDFSYPTASCTPCLLAWYDNGPSCEYADGLGDVLIDMPLTEFYADGIVASGLPATWTGNVNSNWNEEDNWTDCGTPDDLRKVVIPDVFPGTHPVINDTISCRAVEIQEGASLTIISGGKMIIKE